MARPVRPEFLSQYYWKISHVSRKFGENGPPNLIQIFRSERFEAQMFCVPFNNLTILTELMESAQGHLVSIRAKLSNYKLIIRNYYSVISMSTCTCHSIIQIKRILNFDY